MRYQTTHLRSNESICFRHRFDIGFPLKINTFSNLLAISHLIYSKFYEGGLRELPAARDVIHASTLSSQTLLDQSQCEFYSSRCINEFSW